MAVDHEYPTPTRRSGHRYLFTAKHHGGGLPTDSCWCESLSEDMEFGIFDNADSHQISDAEQRLYSVLRQGDSLQEVGTFGQMIAEFRGEGLWHGFPAWPLAHEDVPENRRGTVMRPVREIFQKLEAAGLITTREHRRLWAAKHL